MSSLFRRRDGDPARRSIPAHAENDFPQEHVSLAFGLKILNPELVEAEEVVDLQPLEERSARLVDDDRDPLVEEGDLVAGLLMVERHPGT